MMIFSALSHSPLPAHCGSTGGVQKIRSGFHYRSFQHAVEILHNNVDYGDQQPWISAVDIFYLGQCTLRSFFAVFSALSSLQWIK